MKFTPGLAPQRAEALANTLKVLGDPTRLRIVSLLLVNEGLMAVEDLVDCFDLEQASVSHHLVKLHAAGLLTRYRRKNYVYYSVKSKRLKAELRQVFSLIPD